MAAAFQRDPRWAKAPVEKVEKFRDVFGHTVVTYSNNIVRSNYKGEISTFRYELVERGQDYAVIRSKGSGFGDGTYRVRFVDGGSGIWVSAGKFLDMEMPDEKFDRVTHLVSTETEAQPK